MFKLPGRGRPTQPHIQTDAEKASGLSQSLLNVLQSFFSRPATFIQTPFTVGSTEPLQILNEESRSYLLIVNQSASAQLMIGFSSPPGVFGGTTLNGLILNPLGGYEPLAVPDNSVWVIGSAAGTNGIVIYAR